MTEVSDDRRERAAPGRDGLDGTGGSSAGEAPAERRRVSLAAALDRLREAAEAHDAD